MYVTCDEPTTSLTHSLAHGEVRHEIGPGAGGGGCGLATFYTVYNTVEVDGPREWGNKKWS